jgi:hypothetical protein
MASQCFSGARLVSYKNVLLGRHVAALESKDEPAMLNYIDLRNQEALRAWRQRCAAIPGLDNRYRRRFWFKGLFRTDSLRW